MIRSAVPAGPQPTAYANDDVYEFVMDVAANSHAVDELAHALRRLVEDS